MYSRCHSAVVIWLWCAIGMGAFGQLRVCMDPDNLPFSNRAGEGFENRIAAMVARDLGQGLRETWVSSRKGAMSKSLESGECEVVLGVPAGIDGVLATKAYYESTYVFVERKNGSGVVSLFDDKLATMRIGVQVVGDDFAPPAHAMATRGLGGQLVGFSLFGVEGEKNPPARLIEAVANGAVDIAIAWGPTAGYFANFQPVALRVIPVTPASFGGIPFRYQMTAAVRKGELVLRNRVQWALAKECSAIRGVLADYGIPVTEGQPACDAQPSAASVSR